MRPDIEIPEAPLHRFLDLCREIAGRRTWTQDWSVLRYSAVTLTTVPGDPNDVVRRLFATADVLKQKAGWFGAMTSSIRFAVAAMLIQGDDEAAVFRDVKRIRGLFRDSKLSRGETAETLAALVLRENHPDRRVEPTDVRRFKALYDEMRSHHRWLTGTDDYPACALLCSADGSPREVGARIESFYDGLAEMKFQKGNALQTVSHLLFFNPAPDDVALKRFQSIYAGFKQSGLRMKTGDYDEVAMLSFLEQQPSDIVARVLAHREPIATMRPRPSKDTSFSLACSTAFLDLARPTDEMKRIADATMLMRMQAVLSAQQSAAVIAAATAASTGATAS